MKWFLSFSALLALAATAMSQEAIPAPSAAPGAIEYPDNPDACLFPSNYAQRARGGFLNGTHDFDRFIGFMSNPLQNIDPRAVTEIWPMFMSDWVSTIPALPSGDI